MGVRKGYIVGSGATEAAAGVAESASVSATVTPDTTETTTAAEAATTDVAVTPAATDTGSAAETAAIAVAVAVATREHFGAVFFGFTEDWDALAAESNVVHPSDELTLSGGDEGSATTATKPFP